MVHINHVERVGCTSLSVVRHLPQAGRSRVLWGLPEKRGAD